MAPYYRKFYTLNIPDEQTCQHLGWDYITDSGREARGPIQISYTGAVQDPLAKPWVDTFKGLNLKMSGNPYSGNSIGGYANAATLDPKSKTQSYATTAYYSPASERANLHVLTGVVVKKIGFASGEPPRIANSVSVKPGSITKNHRQEGGRRCRWCLPITQDTRDVGNWKCTTAEIAKYPSSH